VRSGDGGCVSYQLWGIFIGGRSVGTIVLAINLEYALVKIVKIGQGKKYFGHSVLDFLSSNQPIFPHIVYQLLVRLPRTLPRHGESLFVYLQSRSGCRSFAQRAKEV
jgi:hypothetical protein